MADVKSLVRRHAPSILNGVLLAIDPASGASSLPGWALYRAGALVGSGTLNIAGGLVQERLRALYDHISPVSPDVLVIERIRGSRAHEYLHWSVGVAVAAACAGVTVEVPVSSWRAHAGKDHKKSDEADALAIASFVFAVARGAA